MIKISVKNLRLRTIIGFNSEEQVAKQDVVINYNFTVISEKSTMSDETTDIINYKDINKEIIKLVENGKFYLLEKLTKDILDIIMGNEGVSSVSVEVDKPGALRFTDSVSVSLYKEKLRNYKINKGIISIGSNIEPDLNINKALALLKKQFSVIRKTNLIKTKPIGYVNQPNFVNGAVLIETTELLNLVQKELKEMEIALKRKKLIKNPNGPRTIDLDLITWNAEIIDKDYFEKSFVKDFVHELMPEFI